MADALIGYTGFLGGNLARQHPFDDLYNSANIEEIAGRSYGLIACAGAPGRKWLANREPEPDRASIEKLMAALGRASAGHVVLISTVDVYPTPAGVDEDTPIDEAQADAYGRHRRMLERFIETHFAATIVRLPGLFGPGLEKNVIYDFLNDNRLDLINPDSTFQFYDLKNLWRDITRVREAGIALINFATEPVSVRDVASEAFGFAFDNAAPPPPAHYDFRTRWAERLGGSGGYLQTRAEVLEGTRRFVAKERLGGDRGLEHRVAESG